jgi:hypothetical protein
MPVPADPFGRFLDHGKVVQSEEPGGCISQRRHDVLPVSDIGSVRILMPGCVTYMVAFVLNLPMSADVCVQFDRGRVARLP